MMNLALKENNLISYSNELEVIQNQNEGELIIGMYLETLSSNNTKKAYYKAIKDFFDFLYQDTNLTLKMMIVDPATAREYENYWKGRFENGEIKASTFNGKIKGVRQFYEWLIVYTTKNTQSFRLLQVNPFKKVKQIPENDSQGSSPLSPDEVELMLNNPYGHDMHTQERNLLILELGICTGVRNQALINMTLNDIKRIGNDWVLVLVEKGKKISENTINNYYDRLIKWYQKDIKQRQNDKGTIFNIHEVHANRIIKEWANGVGIDKNITFHSLRTTTAVEIFHMGGDNLYKVQMMLNHSHTATSKKYVEKEGKINREGESIIKRIKKLNDFDKEIENLSKEELVKLLQSLDSNTKSVIMGYII